MDWGVIVPNLVTGTVGLAGIGGTLLSAAQSRNSGVENLRRSITAEDERAKLAEKRRIYANCLAAFTQYTAASTQQNEQARTAVRVAVQEVALIGSTSLGELALHVESRGRNANADPSSEKISQIYAQLVMEMRKDLGEPLE